MSLGHGASVVKTGLVLHLDAANLKSYPGSGTTWYDLSGNGYHATLYNSPTYNSSIGAFVLDNIDDYVQLNSNLNLETLGASYNYTIMFGAKKLYYGTGGNNTGNSNLITASSSGYTNGWRVHEDSQGTPGNAFTGPSAYSIGSPDLGSSISISDTVSDRTSLVAFSRSSTQFFAFLNNNTKTEVETTTSYSTGTNYGIVGLATFGVGRFAGNLHFIMIYNRPLSQTEIQKNFEALRGRYGI